MYVQNPYNEIAISTKKKSPILKHVNLYLTLQVCNTLHTVIVCFLLSCFIDSRAVAVTSMQAYS